MYSNKALLFVFISGLLCLVLGFLLNIRFEINSNNGESRQVLYFRDSFIVELERKPTELSKYLTGGIASEKWIPLQPRLLKRNRTFTKALPQIHGISPEFARELIRFLLIDIIAAPSFLSFNSDEVTIMRSRLLCCFPEKKSDGYIFTGLSIDNLYLYPLELKSKKRSIISLQQLWNNPQKMHEITLPFNKNQPLWNKPRKLRETTLQQELTKKQLDNSYFFFSSLRKFNLHNTTRYIGETVVLVSLFLYFYAGLWASRNNKEGRALFSIFALRKRAKLTHKSTTYYYPLLMQYFSILILIVTPKYTLPPVLDFYFHYSYLLSTYINN